jgi:hypothetical protein
MRRIVSDADINHRFTYKVLRREIAELKYGSSKKTMCGA